MADKMRATILRAPGELVIQEFDIPKAKPGEVVVNIKACGICPSGIRMVEGRRKFNPRFGQIPGIPGHESAGIVTEVGEGVKDIKVGDRVAPTLGLPCGVCRYCSKGLFQFCQKRRFMGSFGFAEYLKSFEDGVIKIPDHVSYEEASFAEPLGCAIKGTERANIGYGDNVLIIGVGQMGLMMTQLAKARGARVIVSDLDEKRLNIAKKLGADDLVNPNKGDVIQQVKDLTDGYGADRVIIAIGNKKAIETGIHAADKSGHIVIYAGTWPEVKLEIDPNWIHYNELVLTGSEGAGKGRMTTAINLIGLGVVDVKSLITHRLPLEKIREGQQIHKNREGIKVIINP